MTDFNKANRYSRFRFWFVGLSVMLACSEPQPPKDDSSIVIQRHDNKISIIGLIANPEKYHQQVVQVKGYINLEFEACAIYLQKEDHDLSIDKNGIWVEISKSEMKKMVDLDKRYVILEGTFDMYNKGHKSAYSGSITRLTEIKALNW